MQMHGVAKLLVNLITLVTHNELLFKLNNHKNVNRMINTTLISALSHCPSAGHLHNLVKGVYCATRLIN